jgi:predicted metalloprotease with PDZ domain
VFRLLWKRHAGTDEGFTEADVLDAIAEVGDDELASQVDQRVGQRVLPALDTAVDAVGLRFVVDDGSTPPDLGVAITEGDAGVTLASVLRDRPAWRGGLAGGDRLVAIAGTRVARGQLKHVLRAHDPGDEVEVTVLRGPRLLTRRVTLGEPRPPRRLVRVETPTDAQRTAFRRWTGASLDGAPTG